MDGLLELGLERIMTPQFESHLRRSKWPLILSAVILLCSALSYGSWIIRNSRIANTPIEPKVQLSDEWLYVTTNSVLFFQVENGKCRTERKYALLQVHEGTKVLVISRQGEWVEVETDDQTKLFTHGCINESVLEKRDD